MTTLVPSHIAKVARAKQHIADLDAAVADYAKTKPYEVRTRIEGKKKVRRLAFTASPANTDIPLIAADAIYNLRSALDHLMASMVPKARRQSVGFPIFFRGVWETGPPGEEQQRVKLRGRWASETATLHPGAVAVLKRLQPPDDAGDDAANLLRIINSLSNRDRHEKLPVIAAGLSTMMVRWTMADGRPQGGLSASKGGFFKDQAQIRDIPDVAMDVQITGVPLIAIRVREEKGYIELARLGRAPSLIDEHVISPLTPFVLR